MYKFTYVSSDSGDWSAWYLDGEKLVEGHKITALDLMDVIRHVFPHQLETVYVPDDIAEMGLPESLGDVREIGSDLEEGAWKEFKDCIKKPSPLNNGNELYSKEDRICKNCVNSKRVKNGKRQIYLPLSTRIRHLYGLSRSWQYRLFSTEKREEEEIGG